MLLAPNTLNLLDHARLAIRHMTANYDHRMGYPYFYINVLAEKPVATHNAWDLIDVTSRYIDSLILTREMTGDRHGMEVEEQFRRLLLENIHPIDGLAYRPETPWSVREAEMFDQSRALTALVTWYMKDGTQNLRRYIDRMVEGLWNSAIHIVLRRAGYAYCYYPYAARFEDGWNPATPGEPCCYSGGALILPLVKYAEISGSERALELGRRFLRYIVDESHIFRRDGSFWPEEMHLAAGHFHTRSLSMAGILRYALLVGDEELVQWVKRAFDWAMTTSSSFGWFPEGVGTEDFYTTKHSETCNITDMIHIAIKLAESGYPEYWDHTERFVRNHLIESQWYRPEWMQFPTDSLPEDTEMTSYQWMSERIPGGFAGRTLPNEFTADGVLMGCCCGAGPRALFLAWDHILRRRENGLYVNLLLNRFSREADVLSYLPHQGRVDVVMHSQGPLYVHIPGWVNREALTVEQNGIPIHFLTEKGFACVEKAEPGDRISVLFPLQEEITQEKLLHWTLQVKWRGNTVCAISPEGKRFPLYLRNDLDTHTYGEEEVDLSHRRDPSVRW